MNLFFYLALDRLPLGKSVVIEFIGPIAVAAAFTRSARNSVALALAALGVVTLSGVEIGGEPWGIFFIFAASAMCLGVWKSGSPRPIAMTSCSFAARSISFVR